MTTSDSWRARVGAWATQPLVRRAIITLIILNGISLGLETWHVAVAVAGPALRLFDALVLTVFTLEIALKLYAFRLDFFRQPWNIFDFVVVGISLVPTAGPFSVLRALRILRVLRLLSVLPSMRRAVEALISALPGLFAVGSLLALCFYVSAVLATKLFGASFPQWFGSIGGSMYTLFQVMTLESWSMGIVRPVMDQYPWAWLFFVPFIVAMSFAILNLFIGIIVDAMQTVHAREDAEAAANAPPSAEHQELQALRREVQELKQMLAERLPERE